MPFAVSYLLFYSFLERQTFSAPVFQLNDTAIGIAELIQQTLPHCSMHQFMQNEAAPCVPLAAAIR